MKGSDKLSTPVERMSQWLAEKNYSFAFINSIPNVFYLTGFYCDPHERLLGLLVFPDGPPLLVCPGLEVTRARGAGWQQDILEYSDADNPWELTAQVLRGRVGPKPVIAADKEFLPVARAEILTEIFPGAKLVPADEKLLSLRKIKTPSEIGHLQQAGRLADRAIEIAVATLAEGVTETEIAAEIEYNMRKLGASSMAFSTIVLFGPRTAISHGVPGDTRLKPGDLVLLDLGVVWGGYCSDITRTFAYKTISPQFKKIYDVTLEAQLAALAACRPGNQVGDVDLAAREVIVAAGYGDNTGRRVGHGIGIEIHEYPSVAGENHDLLYPGMAFTVEPGIYFDGVGGVRIEDDVLITPDGYQLFTKYPKELQIIG